MRSRAARQIRRILFDRDSSQRRPRGAPASSVIAPRARARPPPPMTRTTRREAAIRKGAIIATLFCMKGPKRREIAALRTAIMGGSKTGT